MPNFKKIISAVCALSMFAASAAIPAFADVDTAEGIEARENISELSSTAETAEAEIALTDYAGYDYYNESFDDFSGTLVDLQNGSNTTYKASHGLTFSCGTRSSGTGVSIEIKNDSSTGHGNYLSMIATALNRNDADTADTRTPYFEFPRMSGQTAENELYITFDVRFDIDTVSGNTPEPYLALTDGNKEIDISRLSHGTLEKGKWYHFTLISYIEEKENTVIVTDSEGNLISKTDDGGALTALTKISAFGGNYITIGLDNIVISDASVPNVTISDVERVITGEKTEIAKVTNASNVNVDVDNDAFVADYDAETGVVSITPDENAAGQEVNAVITASNNKTLSFAMSYAANTTEGYAQESADAIDLVQYNTDNSNTNISLNSDKLYAVGDFVLPIEDRGAEISWSSSDKTVISTTKSGKATVIYPDTATDVTLTATVKYNRASVTKDFVVSVMTAQENLDNAVAGLDISGLEKSGTSYIASDDFTVPTSYSGANIEWSSSDTDMLSVGDNGTIYVYPAKDGTVTLTATLTSGSASATKTFTIDTSAYYAEYKAAFDQAVTEANKFYYAGDTSCADITTDAVNGALIFNDLYLPETRTVTVGDNKYTMTYVWEIAENDYINADGTLNVNDKELHSAAASIKLTVKYVKNGKDVFSESKTYSVDVQFNPEDIANTVKTVVENNYIIDTTTSKKEETTTAAREAAMKKYLEAFVYDKQIQYDYAYTDNFKDIPSTASSTTNLTLPLKGFFGSDFVWMSSSNCLKIEAKSGDVTITTPSSTTSVTLTAVISAGTSKTKDYTSKISVKGKSSSGGGGGGGGGGSTTSSGGSSNGSVVAATTDNITVTPEPAAVINPNPSGFTDLDSVSWALTAINNLYVNGVINGKEANKFYPNDSVTRAEFAKMLVLTFDIDKVAVSSATFTDVPLSSWASEYVEAAYNSGIIAGFDDGSFDPNAEITRQDMAVMVYRAMTAAGYTVEDKTEAVTFTDDDIIASYSKEAVSSLQRAKVIDGLGDGSFGPLNTSTRAQACQIIYNVFNK